MVITVNFGFIATIATVGLSKALKHIGLNHEIAILAEVVMKTR